MSENQAQVLQAEAAARNGAKVEDDNPGFTGGGYVDFSHSVGDWIEWPVDGGGGGSHRLTFRYANGSAGDRPLELRINGAVVRPRMSFPPTGSWREWATVFLDVPLSAGQNRVRLTTAGDNGGNIDSLTVQPLSPSQARTFEAEAATISGAGVRSTHSGFTGTGYVDFAHASGDFVQWTVNVPMAAVGPHTLRFRYANGSTADRPLALRVNDSVVVPRLSFPPTGSWRTWEMVGVNVPLVAGDNRVRLTAVGSGGPNIDSLSVLPQPQPAQKLVRAYHVGNSVTDTIRYNALKRIANSRGDEYVFGRHMIPGAPLDWIWEHPAQGFKENPYGYYPNALPNYEWDALTLQPFDRLLQSSDGRGDLQTAPKFIDLALPRSPDLQIYVYQRWPKRRDDGSGNLTLDYQAQWLRTYTGSYDGSNETRDYFQRVVQGLRDHYPGLPRPVLMVPVGDVLFELDRRMQDGQVPGYTDVVQFYVDSIHFNNVGAMVVGTTFYATMFRSDPRGTDYSGYDAPSGPLDSDITPAQAAAFQDAVWDVVSTHPLAGVAGST